MFCKNCGRDVREDSQFCWNCGTNIAIKNGSGTVSTIPTIDSVKKIKCKNCGDEIYDKIDICPHCGTRLRFVIIRNPGMAAVLSFFVPGLGQIYDGEIIIGVAFFIIELLLVVLAILLIRTSQPKEGAIFLFACLVFWIYNIHAARKLAEKENKKQY